MMTEKMDRRKYKRNRLKAVADVFNAENKLVSMAEVCNVSPEGAAILTASPMDVGSKLAFNILIKESKKIKIIIENAACEVIRMEKEGEKWLHAVIFKDMRLEDKLVLGNVNLS